MKYRSGRLTFGLWWAAGAGVYISKQSCERWPVRLKKEEVLQETLTWTRTQRVNTMLYERAILLPMQWDQMEAYRLLWFYLLMSD